VREHGGARERRRRCGFSTSSKIDGVEQAQSGGSEGEGRGGRAEEGDHRERRRWAPRSRTRAKEKQENRGAGWNAP